MGSFAESTISASSRAWAKMRWSTRLDAQMTMSATAMAAAPRCGQQIRRAGARSHEHHSSLRLAAVTGWGCLGTPLGYFGGALGYFGKALGYFGKALGPFGGALGYFGGALNRHDVTS